MNQFLPGSNTFLILENDADDAFLIKRALLANPRCGSSFVCRNASEAKAFLLGAGMYADRQKYPFPAIIICDLNLGSDSGIEFVTWLRHQEPPLKEMPVVILSGSATQDQFDAAAEIGAQRLYRKPAKLEQLQSILSTIAHEFCPDAR